MSNTAHNRVHRASRINREGTTRTRLRTSLSTGNWDAIETRMSSRSNRRANLAG